MPIPVEKKFDCDTENFYRIELTKEDEVMVMQSKLLVDTRY